MGGWWPATCTDPGPGRTWRPEPPIDADGWFHTGDIAEVDADGRVRIVDRKKEIIVMSNGKNVAPQPIENALKSSNLIEMAMCIGDRRNFITALLVPNFEALKVWATEHKLDGLATPELLKHAQVQSLFKREVDAACAPFARYEQVKKFALLSEAFDPAKNELTPTLKVKRRVIGEHYAEAIEGLYESETVSA
jgi:long-chain acyl-CoA synthetase